MDAPASHSLLTNSADARADFHADRPHLAIVASALLLHIAGLCLIDWLEQPGRNDRLAQEIPVELLTTAQADAEKTQGRQERQGRQDPSAPEKNFSAPDAPKANENQAASATSTLNPGADDSALTVFADEKIAKGAQPNASSPKGVILERPTVTDLPQEPRKRGSRTPDKERKDQKAADKTAETRSVLENTRPEKEQGKAEKPNEQKSGAPTDAAPSPFGALAPAAPSPAPQRLPAFLAPDRFQSAQAPRPSSDPSNDNYRAAVLGKVAENMIDPNKPRPKALAVVAFRLNASGEIESISLARPSGYAELDAEAMDMVRRSAPFPPPPANADRNFGAAIAFGED